MLGLRGLGPGDLLAAGLVVIGLTIVLLLTESYLVVAFSSLREEWSLTERPRRTGGRRVIRNSLPNLQAEPTKKATVPSAS